MTTSVFSGYSTTDNSTWSRDLRNQSNRTSHVTDPKEMLELKARFIPIILIAVPANLGIIVIILKNQATRTQAFFLGVLSISIFELCYGVFVLPMSLESWSDWHHGDNVCIAFRVLEISRTLLSCLMAVALCAERLLAKLQSASVIGQKMASSVSKGLVVLPWCIGSLMCAPVISLNRRDLSHRFPHDKYCVYVLESATGIPVVTTMFLFPICLLVLVPIVTAIVYKYKRLRFNSRAEPETVRLNMSTFSAWVVSFVYFVLMVPMVTTITLFVMCLHRQAKCPSGITYRNVLTISLLPSALTPLLWTITVEVRESLASLKAAILDLVTPTDGRKSVFSFASIRNKMSSDDTVSLS